jgi:hypothetical protein
LYMYAVLSFLKNVIIIILFTSLLCMHETHIHFVMTVLVIRVKPML